MTVPAVRVTGLGVSYGPVAALTDVDLEVGDGEVMALLGSSGSGKTTLLSTVAGFLQPVRGTVVIGGREVAGPTTWVEPEARRVGLVFQGAALWPHLTVLATVAYPIRRSGRSKAAAAHEAGVLLERLGLSVLADRLPAQLSGGEQQRVGLARALARDPAVFCFDEPTAHLDTHLRSVVLEEITRRRAALGAAGLYATHNATEALAIADRVAVLRSGRLVQVGTPREVYDQPVDAETARLTGPAAFLDTGTGRLLVRPDWVAFGGEVSGRIESVRYRGPYTDHTVNVDGGDLLVSTPGPSGRRPGDLVDVTISRTWALPPAPGARTLREVPAEVVGTDA
jgi:ABC-type Fe3+/spermidine/putrescine transport system ATPase subunit